MITDTARAYAAGLCLGLMVLALAGGLSVPPLAVHGDFAEQWAASRFALEGGNPYDTTAWRDAAARLAGRASDATAFAYPPYVTIALLPLAALPLEIAATIWVAASLLLSALALRSLLRALPPLHPLIALAFGFALFASGASLLALAQGQSDLLLFAGVAWSIAALKRGGDIAPGAVTLLLKPQLAPFTLLGLARATSGHARRRLAIGIGIALALIGITVVPRMEWWTDWVRGIATFQSAPPIRSATLATLTAPFGLVGVIAMLTIITVSVGLALRLPRIASLPVWLATSVLIAPYAQSYDHLLLLPAVVLASGMAARRSQRAAAIVAGSGVATLVLGGSIIAGATASAGHDVLGALVPLAVWCLVAVVALSRRKGQDQEFYSPTSF